MTATESISHSKSPSSASAARTKAFAMSAPMISRRRNPARTLRNSDLQSFGTYQWSVDRRNATDSSVRAPGSQ